MINEHHAVLHLFERTCTMYIGNIQVVSLQTFHLTEPCALHRAVHMLHAHNRYSLACLSLQFISIAFSFVIRDIQNSLYTAMTAYMLKALIMAFVLFLYIDFLHMFMLLFNFYLIHSFPNWRVVRCQRLFYFYRTISVWIPYTSIISIDTFTNGQVKEKLNTKMHGKRRRKTLSSSSSSVVKQKNILVGREEEILNRIYH